MPVSETLSTDEISARLFTCIPSNGTPPYSYEWSASPDIPFVVSGGDGESITFNTNNVVGGFYNVQVRTVVTDDVGDVVVVTDGYQLTVTPFTATLSGSLVQGEMFPDATGSSVVTASGYAEGQAPYTLTARWGGGQPDPSIDFVITGNTTVEITTTATPVGGYIGALEVTAQDNLGQAVTEIFTVSINVVAAPDSPDPIIEALGPGLDYRFQEASGSIVNYGGLGSTWDMVPKNPAQLTYQVAAGGLPGNGDYAVRFDPSTPNDPVLRVDDAVADFSELNWSTGTVIVAFKVEADTGNNVQIINPRQNTLNRDYFQLLTGNNQGYPSLIWASGSDIGINGLTNLGAGSTDYGIQDGVRATQNNFDGWHVVMWVQRGDGTGPIMFVDGEPYHADSVAGSNLDNWFDDRYTDWDWLAIGAQIATDGESALGNSLDGLISRVALMPIPATNAQVYDIFRLMKGLDFTAGEAYQIFMRYLYRSASGLSTVLEEGHTIQADYKEENLSFGYGFAPDNTPQTWTTSGTSNPAPGATLVADPAGRPGRAWGFTGQWRFSSSTGIDPLVTWGLSSGSFALWFRRPDANLGTASINSLLARGTNTSSTLEQGIQLSFRAATTLANDPDTLSIGWMKDVIGTVNSAWLHIDAPDDTDWHMVAVTADGVSNWKVYLDGVLQSSPASSVFGTGSLIEWGDTQNPGVNLRPGTGNGGICRTYADWWGLQTFPNNVLSAADILNAYRIMVGQIQPGDVGSLLP